MHSLKNGSTKAIIGGLSKSGEQYDEAVQCHIDRFNRPKLIHKAHVYKGSSKNDNQGGNGKELGALHNTAQQHICALKCMSNKQGQDIPHLVATAQAI